MRALPARVIEHVQSRHVWQSKSDEDNIGFHFKGNPNPGITHDQHWGTGSPSESRVERAYVELRHHCSPFMLSRSVAAYGALVWLRALDVVDHD